MFALFSFGSALEQIWGAKKFLFFQGILAPFPPLGLINMKFYLENRKLDEITLTYLEITLLTNPKNTNIYKILYDFIINYLVWLHIE